MNLKKAIIVDLDGCLFDTSEIIELLPNSALEWTREQWDVFQENYNRDFPIIKFVKRTIGEWGKTHSILFVTSREARNNVVNCTLRAIQECFKEELSSQRGSFCSEGYIKHYELLMRNDCDYRSSSEVKRDIYTMFIKDRYSVEFALDDEQQNIDMWVSLGIPCLKVVR